MAVGLLAVLGALASGVAVPSGEHFTTLIGAVHNGSVTFWSSGGTASAARQRGNPRPILTREVVPDHHPAVESISWEQDEIEDIHLGLPKSD